MTEFERKFLKYILDYGNKHSESFITSRKEDEAFRSWYQYYSSEGVVGTCPSLHQVGVLLERIKRLKEAETAKATAPEANK